ncbi:MULTISPECIES: hypothetical protein [unclassified Frankia]|uniref:DUF6919 domain-containing protein n=1 Tax=unclassified Frankia TaxID=2632575 RepID=UPI0006CA4618|nr:MULTISPECIES: hypothetical protein [unclassified Frankia]
MTLGDAAPATRGADPTRTTRVAPLNWLTARNLSDLGELTARWLEGTVATGPAFGGALDEQTRTIAPRLASINRRGLVTLASQPAQRIADGYGRRAFVEGFIDEPRALTVSRMLLGTDIILLIRPPAWSATHRSIRPARPAEITVEISAGMPLTRAGNCHTYADIKYLYGMCGGCSRRAVASLGHACQVTAIDPVWGRPDYLWEALSLALTSTGPGRPPARAIIAPR